MDIQKKERLEELVTEVFIQNEKSYAELRLFPADAEELTKQYNLHCTPMDNSSCPDGKVWYRVCLLTVYP